jgi:hypothetical protein
LDLQRVHGNVVNIYDEVASLFVDLSTLDNKHMPIRLTEEESLSKVIKFVNNYGIKSDLVKRRLDFLASNLRTGESVTTSNERVFLRGCAYTMVMANRHGKELQDVHFAPRLVSTGNALSVLGFFYQKEAIVDLNWIRTRDERQEFIAKYLKEA